MKKWKTHRKLSHMYIRPQLHMHRKSSQLDTAIIKHQNEQPEKQQWKHRHYSPPLYSLPHGPTKNPTANQSVTSFPIVLYFSSRTVGMMANPILQPRPRWYALLMNVSEVDYHIITSHNFTTTLEFLGLVGVRISGNGSIECCGAQGGGCGCVTVWGFAKGVCLGDGGYMVARGG